MYTEEDFWRDYPPTEEPFLLPWQKEYHDRKVEEAAQLAAQETAKLMAQQAEETAQKVAQEATQAGFMAGKMKTAKALLLMGMDVSMISQATELSEEQILSLNEPVTGSQS